MSRAIDAEALREVLMRELGNRSMQGFGKGLLLANSCVIHAPTIEPERKTGKWINANDGKWNTVEVLKCSVCGEIDNRMYRTDNFCPNCGAKMEEGEQDGKDT